MRQLYEKHLSGYESCNNPEIGPQEVDYPSVPVLYNTCVLMHVRLACQAWITCKHVPDLYRCHACTAGHDLDSIRL